MSSQVDVSGTRENLTPSQDRALYRLWQRFFRLCDTPVGYLGQTTSSHGPSVSTTGPASADTSGQASQPSSSAAAAAAESSSSSSREKVAGSAADASGQKDGEAGLRRAVSTPLHAREGSTTSAATAAGGGGGYGKPLQRQSSNVRQIDERGGQIPKDDRVKDELKTLEEAKEMREFLERYGGERLRQIFWDMVKGEHPDAVMLRFLRARKWNVDRAIAVIGSTAAFRADNDVMQILKGGELEVYRTRGGRNLLRNGISYIYGASSIGEPIYFIEVGRHFSHNQTQEELKNGIIFLQEYLQLLMPPPIERKVVVFNMNDFGIRNMDWWCVFFMVKTMESYYVETLSRVYVHGAPWIFKPIWAILKPLLDPVVRDKVRLTFTPQELAEHIPFEHLPKNSMRGGMDWEFELPEPDPHENDMQLDTKKRDELVRQYMAVASEFEAATREIATMYAQASLLQRGPIGRRTGRAHDLAMSSDEDDEDMLASRRGSAGTAMGISGLDSAGDDIGAGLKARRDVLATKLRVAFLRLKPYIVGKNMVDRWGVTQEDGSIIWRYPHLSGEVEEQVLGLGTTLPELERNLAMIEQASSAAAHTGEAGTAAQDDGSSERFSSDAKRPASRQDELTKSALTSQLKQGEMNRRQQRLKNRSRPVSAALEVEALHSGPYDENARTDDGLIALDAAEKSPTQTSPAVRSGEVTVGGSSSGREGGLSDTATSEATLPTVQALKVDDAPVASNGISKPFEADLSPRAELEGGALGLTTEAKADVPVHPLRSVTGAPNRSP